MCPEFLWVRAHEADQFGQGAPKVTESVNRFSHAVPIAFKRVPIVDATPLNSKSWWENLVLVGNHEAEPGSRFLVFDMGECAQGHA